ncbi:efflux RND transporter periplasmic adaptor subunit [Silvibacterium acidisoli]|uniref:efflux RND transporter periplasmic adaptor subunit n=1 Tax=Acidobacteriaceae bacterium ZG23-2 TaxID=2883246 RepID=UPI00406C7C1E
MEESVNAQASAPQPSPISPHHSPEPHRSSRGRWIVFIVVVVLLLAAVVHYRRKKKQEKPAANAENTPVRVVPATAEIGDMNVYVRAIGTVTPVATDTITAQVTGVIKAVHYSEGQSVKKGDLLIEIDPRLYDAQLAEARGALDRDQNTLAEARMDLERYRQAWSRNGVSRQQLEDQEKTVLADQGTVSYDQGAVQYAQAERDYCDITAPISGRVGLRLVDAGNLVTANATTALVVITQVAPITTIFPIAEDQLPAVLTHMNPHHPLAAQAFDRDQQSLLAEGRLTTVDNQIDTTTGTAKLRATFANSDGRLFPNQFVNVRLLVDTLHQQVLVPASAIQHNGQQAYVFLLDQGKAAVRNVTVGATDNGQTAVTGIAVGDVLADSSFEKLQSGTAVTLMHAAPLSAASPSNGAAQ